MRFLFLRGIFRRKMPPAERLEELLLSLFKPDAFRRWLELDPVYSQIVNELPGTLASPLLLVHQAVVLLDGRGHIDAEFFLKLIKKFERRADDVAKVAQAWEPQARQPDEGTSTELSRRRGRIIGGLLGGGAVLAILYVAVLSRFAREERDEALNAVAAPTEATDSKGIIGTTTDVMTNSMEDEVVAAVGGDGLLDESLASPVVDVRRHSIPAKSQASSRREIGEPVTLFPGCRVESKIPSALARRIRSINGNDDVNTLRVDLAKWAAGEGAGDQATEIARAYVAARASPPQERDARKHLRRIEGGAENSRCKDAIERILGDTT